MGKEVWKNWSTLNVKQAGDPRASRSKENVQRVSASVRHESDLSTRKSSTELGILYCVMKLELKLHPYKMQFVQELKPNDLNLY